MSSRVRPLLGLVAVLCASVLVACGDDDAGGGASAQSADAGAFPATVRSQFGSATVERAPKRVVALDFPSSDAALALGVTPVGIGKVSYVPGGVQAWTKAALRGATPTQIDSESSVQVERIAALRPDLILATSTFPLDRKTFAKLSRVAPVVTWDKGALKDSWQTTTLRIGRALGRADRAQALVRDTESRVQAARRAHPEFADKSVTLFNYVESTAFAISRPSDYSMRFLGALGMHISDPIRTAKEVDGRVAIGPEQLKLLEADLLLGTTPERGGLARLGRQTLFKRLKVVQGGHYQEVGIGPATSIAFPSVLGVRYALTEVVPTLARGVAGT